VKHALIHMITRFINITEISFKKNIRSRKILQRKVLKREDIQSARCRASKLSLTNGIITFR